MAWFAFDMDAYDADTMHLSAAEDGMYSRLLRFYYKTRVPLPDDDRALASIARVSPVEWETSKTTLRAFFKSRRGKLHHKRCDKELDREDSLARQRSEKAKNAAEKRHGKTRASVPRANTEHVPSKATVMLGDATRPDQTRPDQMKKEDDASASSGAPKENPHGRSSRGSRLSRDWQPSAEDRDFAATLELNPDETAAEFRDYWCGVPGSKGTKLDWSATYRNRCRELATRGPRRSSIQRLGPATGIAQGFADALRMGDGEPHEDRRPYQPPSIALLGGQRG